MNRRHSSPRSAIERKKEDEIFSSFFKKESERERYEVDKDRRRTGRRRRRRTGILRAVLLHTQRGDRYRHLLLPLSFLLLRERDGIIVCRPVWDSTLLMLIQGKEETCSLIPLPVILRKKRTSKRRERRRRRKEWERRDTEIKSHSHADSDEWDIMCVGILMRIITG